MNFRKHIQEQGLGIQLAPLIDIVFLILIWFISASIYARWETKIGVSVPTAKTGEHQRRSPGEVIVNIDREGRLFVNSVEISKDTLRGRLMELKKIFHDQPVVIRADENAYYKHAVGVLDLCREADIDAIAFSVVPPENAPARPAP